ncbi:hypothetical protein ACFO1S_11330 [Cohnella boryungensis]|uniref:Polyketide cyclase/dehydrase/lipid transport protein n=2 Tax=Cohnella boryungensis TaxID=768479 RepID=A0ABV8S8W4_9BACL
MLTFEYSYNFENSAKTLFSHIVDLEARSSWINGILENRVNPEGPARLGSSYFESGKFSGFKSEKTMVVTEFVQDQLLTLETSSEVKQPFRESYRIESISEKACRVYCTIEVGGVPKVGEFFMRQSMKKEQPKNFARLKAIVGG